MGAGECCAQDEEVLHTWLVGLRLDDYYQMFVVAGYDMPTISRMTPEVLTEFCFITLVACHGLCVLIDSEQQVLGLTRSFLCLCHPTLSAKALCL